MIKLDQIENMDVRDALSLASEHVLKNSTLETPESLKQKHLYHITYIKQDKFYPNVSRRGAWSEDNTFPRLCCAPDLERCINGFAALRDTVLDSFTKKDPYKGGFYIYSFEFDYCLRPNKKLVYDADFTNEMWLFNYNSPFIKPAHVDTFLIAEIKIIPGVGKKHRSDFVLELCIENNSEIAINEKKGLSRGYYTLTAGERTLQNYIAVDKIEYSSKERYQHVKQHHTAMEAHSTFKLNRW